MQARHSSSRASQRPSIIAAAPFIEQLCGHTDAGNPWEMTKIRKIQLVTPPMMLCKWKSLHLKQLGPAPINSAKLKVHRFELVYFRIICLLCIETFLSLLLIAGATFFEQGIATAVTHLRRLHSLAALRASTRIALSPPPPPLRRQRRNFSCKLVFLSLQQAALWASTRMRHAPGAGPGVPGRCSCRRYA